jgi:hypothetical protein
LSHSLVPNDRVLSIQFDESNYEDKEQEASVVKVEEIVPEKPLMAPPGAWPSQPQASWGRKVDPIKDIRRELEALRVRQAALEESKFSGRDVDEADAEIQEIEIKKEQLKKLLPRKRFLYIF